MNIQWWQDGVHITPSDDRERKALALLFEAIGDAHVVRQGFTHPPMLSDSSQPEANARKPATP